MTLQWSMTSPRPGGWVIPKLDLDPRKRVICDRCGGIYLEGDWPWCKGKQEEHFR